MKRIPAQYLNVTQYNVIGRITIKELLERKDYYQCCYYVIDEKDDPLPIKDSTSWLRVQRGNKKVYVLKYDTTYGEFIDKETDKLTP